MCKWSMCIYFFTEQAGEIFSVSICIYLCMPKNTVYIKSPGLCKIPAKPIYSKTACACKPKVKTIPTTKSNFTQDAAYLEPHKISMHRKS